MIKQRKRSHSTTVDEKSQSKVAKLENVDKKKQVKVAKTTKDKFKGIKKSPAAKTLDKNGKPDFKKKSGKPGKSDKKGSDAPAEKTDWRKFKEEKKELKMKRKQTKDIYEISIEAKKLYEQLKCHRTSNKAELVDKLFKLFAKDDILRKMTLAHDTARIVQCMLKNASPELHSKMCELLLPHIVEMSMSKYAHFCVLRMLKNGSSSLKARLADNLMGSVMKMASHSLANKILDNIYLNLSSSQQQAYMRQEFYGEMYRRNKDAAVKQLSDTYKDTSNMKAGILSTVKSHLDRLANKELIDNSLVHAVMLEYVNACDEEKMEETITAFSTLIPHMLTTKEGCQAAIICFFKGASKHRRAIIKALKEHLVKICTHEQGHVFIIALINCLDDTKATKKAIYDHIHAEIETLMSNPWGRRVIEWFISPADTNCFHPTFIASMDEGLQYSKKEKEARRKEIFEAVQEPIATAITENPKFWLSDRHIALVTANILKKLTPEFYEKAANALASVVASADWTVDEETKATNDESKKKAQDVEQIIATATKLKRKKQKKLAEEHDTEDDDDDEEENKSGDNEKKNQIKGIEDAGLHVALKKIIKNDKDYLNKNNDGQTFGAALLEALNDEVLKNWLTVNRACFILQNIYENNNESTKSKLQQLLRPYKSLLEAQQQSSGARLLLKI